MSCARSGEFYSIWSLAFIWFTLLPPHNEENWKHFIHHHWQLLDKHEVEGEFKSPFVQRNASEEEESIECNHVAWASDRVFLLQTISNVSVELPPEPAADLAHNLLKRVLQFNMHSTEVIITCLHGIIDRIQHAFNRGNHYMPTCIILQCLSGWCECVIFYSC